VVDNTNFKFNLSSDDNVVISIYDMRGNVVKTINLGKKTTGSHLFNFDSSNLNKGTYLIQIISGNQKATSKFIKF
jgi:flagellar hook assembly protein FlgD